MIKKITLEFWIDHSNPRGDIELDINSKYIVYVLSDDIIYNKKTRYCICRKNHYLYGGFIYLVELSKHDWFSQLSQEDKYEAIWEIYE